MIEIFKPDKRGKQSYRILLEEKRKKVRDDYKNGKITKEEYEKALHKWQQYDFRDKQGLEM